MYTKFYRMLKLNKIFKIIKISSNPRDRILKNLQDMSMNSSSTQVKRLLNFVKNFIIISHMIACKWVFIGKQMFPSWITDSNLLDSEIMDQYLASLYFHWATIFTIGYWRH